MVQKNEIDKQLDLYYSVGQQGLYDEDWQKDFINDNRMSRADGDFSNASGQNNCKNTCESLFGKADEKTLREACKNMCKSKCTLANCKGFTPTRETVCLSRGLNANCTPKDITSTASAPGTVPNVLGVAPLGSASSTASSNSSSPSTGMSMGMKVGIGLGIVLIGVVVTIYIKRKNK